MAAKYIIDLSPEERDAALVVINSGKEGVRRRTRARILIAAAAGLACEQIAASMSTSTSTVYRVRKRFVEGGLVHALSEKSRQGGLRKLSAKDEATLVAIACSKAPTGRSKWTLQLLADRLVALTDHDSVSTETVRRRLKELKLKPWQSGRSAKPALPSPRPRPLAARATTRSRSARGPCFDPLPVGHRRELLG